ncbi:MAG: glucosyl-3-phosphoglycerate synthase [Chloroflexi bacterium]|nr:glucosyl-3-phosphoglycerate synthase [Chloroflexota bacterium]
MISERKFELFRKVLVPVVAGFDPTAALTAARLIGGEENLLLLGLVRVALGDSLSVGATRAQELRKVLGSFPKATRIKPQVSFHPWQALVDIAAEEKPDLLVLEWPSATEALGATIDEILNRPPCDICLIRQPIIDDIEKILVPIRGGPFSELALRIGLEISITTGAQLSSLHIRPPQAAATPTQRRNARKQDAAFDGIARVLANLPEIKQHHLNTTDPAGTIIRYARNSDLVIMGASAKYFGASIPFGETAGKVLRESKSGVIIVKTKRPMPTGMQLEAAGQKAISVLVDKWFAENTYHADEFENLNHLHELKEQQALTISVALPALDEQKTIGRVIRSIKENLVDHIDLVDEIILMDSGSTDQTREIASRFGIPVYIHQEVLPQYGPRHGKGEALWKSLYVTKGDIILWIDTDILNINPRFIYGLIGPLLIHPELQFVKGFYRRPIRVGNRIQAGGGGRVTELTARPLLNLFFPELSGVVQPLSGEYGGRRSALETLPFFSGYGVETGLLIEAFEKYGLSAIGQVDLQERVHHNQPLEALSLMSFAIIQVVIRELEKRYGRKIQEDVNRTMKLIRYGGERFFLDVEEISEQERPPMASLPEYIEKRRNYG